MKKKLRLKTFRKNIIQLVIFLLYLVLSIVIDIINEKKQG